MKERWNRFIDRVNRSALISRARELFESMSPRDRRLFVMLACFLVLGLLSTAVYSGNKYLNRQEQDIARKQDQLTRVLTIRMEHETLKRQIEALENELKSDADFNLTSFLERSSNDIGFDRTVNIQTKGETAGDGFTERAVEVKVRKAPLDKIIRLLYMVEVAPQRLSIKSLRIRTAFGSREKLDADFEVTLLTPQEA